MSGDDDLVRYLMGDDVDGEIDASSLADMDSLNTLLADPAMWDEPPAGLSDSIVSAIGQEAAAATTSSIAPAAAAPSVVSPIPATARRKNRRWTGWVGPALVGAAAAGLIAVAVTRGDDGNNLRAADGTIALSGTDLLPDVSGKATVREEQSGVWIQFDVPGLPRRDGTDFYQAWLKNADGTLLVPIGSFHEGDHVVLWAGVSIDEFPILTVTKESAAGPTSPEQGSSGEVVVRGEYVEP